MDDVDTPRLWRTQCRITQITATGHVIFAVPAASVVDRFGDSVSAMGVIAAARVPAQTLAQFRRGAYAAFRARSDLDPQPGFAVAITEPFESAPLPDPTSALAVEIGSVRLLGDREQEAWVAANRAQIDAFAASHDQTSAQVAIVCRRIINGDTDATILREEADRASCALIAQCRPLVAETVPRGSASYPALATPPSTVFHNTICMVHAISADGLAIVTVSGGETEFTTIAVADLPAMTVRQFQRGADAVFFAQANIAADFSWQLELRGPFEASPLLDPAPRDPGQGPWGHSRLMSDDLALAWTREHADQLEAIDVQAVNVAQHVIAGNGDQTIATEMPAIATNVVNRVRQLVSRTVPRD